MILMQLTTQVVRPKKSYDTIQKQMDRIYKLYELGYGSKYLLNKCEDIVYILFSNMEY